MRYVLAFIESLRLHARLWAWAYRRHFLCPRRRHTWSYFGRERVCRACHREEHRDASGEWRNAAAKGWAVSVPHWHRTEPEERNTQSADER